MARDDFARGDAGDAGDAWGRRVPDQRDDRDRELRGDEQQWRGTHFGGFGGNASGYGRGGALDQGYGGFDVGGRDADWGIGGARGPAPRSADWGAGGDRTRDWRGAEWRGADWRGESPRWDDRSFGDRAFGDRGFEARRRHDPHGQADQGLYGGEQAIAQPGPYHGGYSTMERLAREERAADWGGPGSPGSAGDFSTDGFNAGDLGPTGEYRDAAMRGAVSEIGYSEARMGRPRLGAESARPSYAGRGPRGYRRSDERIREDVCEALTRHPEIDASDVDVSVQEGEVTLSGAIDHRQAKRLAEDVAEQCSGVRDVHNHLRVGGARDAGRNDDSPYRAS